MRKVVAAILLSLDGVMQGPGDIDEDRDGGFDQGGWTLPYIDDEFIQFKVAETLASDTLLLGRKTYAGAADSWPHATDEIGFADKMNSMPKYVVSTTLTSGSWHPTTVIKGNVAQAIAELKAQPGGNIYIYGSNTLVQSLMQQDLIDEYRLMIYPVVLGSGKRLFQAGTIPAELKLVESQSFSSGVVALTYQPANRA